MGMAILTIRYTKKLGIVAILISGLLGACTSVPDITDQAVAYVTPIEDAELGYVRLERKGHFLSQMTRATHAVRATSEIETSARGLAIDAGEVLYSVTRRLAPSLKTYCGVPARRSGDKNNHTCISDDDGDGRFESLWKLDDQFGYVDISGATIIFEEVLETAIQVEEIPESEYPEMILHIQHSRNGNFQPEISFHTSKNRRVRGTEPIDVKKRDLPRIYDFAGAKIRVLKSEGGVIEAEILSGLPIGVPIPIYARLLVIEYVYY